MRIPRRNLCGVFSWVSRYLKINENEKADETFTMKGFNPLLFY
jgi:hypothetical protein